MRRAPGARPRTPQRPHRHRRRLAPPVVPRPPPVLAGKDEHTATALDRYFSLAYSVRDRLMKRSIETQQAYYQSDAKRVYYLSLEFLMGKALENNLINLGLHDGVRDALAGVGLEWPTFSRGAGRGARQVSADPATAASAAPVRWRAPPAAPSGRRRSGPTICTPIGRPLRARPHGTEAAGCCVRLNG